MDQRTWTAKGQEKGLKKLGSLKVALVQAGTAHSPRKQGDKITRGRWTNRDEDVKRYFGTWAWIANSRDFKVEPHLDSRW